MMFAHHWLQPDQVEAVNKAGSDIEGSLLVIIGAVGVFLSRLVIAWVGKKFPVWAGEVGKGSSGGLIPCFMLGLLAAGSLFASLSSCSTAQLASAEARASKIPLKACYIAPDGTQVCYSSRDGVEVDVGNSSVDGQSGK